MAVIIRGIRKHEVVRIADIQGEFAVLENGKRMRLGMLEADRTEQDIIERSFCDSETFRIYYDLDHFKATGRFKKHHWASTRG